MMHLDSPIFDRIRIPPRLTPEAIAMAVCEESGLDLEEVRSLDLPSRGAKTQAIRNARLRICSLMRQHGWPRATITAWFVGISERTVRDYIYGRSKREEIGA